MSIEAADDRAALMADFGEAVTYTPTGGSAVSVTAVIDRPIVDADIGRSGYEATAWTGLLAVDDVAAPARGDQVATADATLTLRSAKRDATGKFWLLDLQEV